MPYDHNEEPCDYCGNEPDECICHLAPDFPDDPIDELDTDYLDWEYHFEETADEINRAENPGKATQD